MEVKILGASHKDLESKLFELGAEKIFDGIIDAYFFDNFQRDIRNAGETLRLRTEGERTVMTYKKVIPSDTVKIRDETEINVSDFEEARKLLEGLGYTCYDNVTKRRITYRINDTKFEFDIHQGKNSFIPEFFEIEGQNPEEIYNYAEKLGFSKEDCTNYSITELKEKYSKD